VKNGDARLLLMQPGIRQRLMGVLHGARYVPGIFNRGFSTSALLLPRGK
jgi:hypothetical protein